MTKFVDDYIEQLSKGIASPEIQKWSGHKLRVFYDKKKRAGLSIPKEEPSYTCIIKKNGRNCKIYVSDKLTVLESHGLVVATYKDGNYYVVYGSAITEPMAKNINCFLAGNEPKQTFHFKYVQEAIDRIDTSNPKYIDYSRYNDKTEFWSTEPPTKT